MCICPLPSHFCHFVRHSSGRLTIKCIDLAPRDMISHFPIVQLRYVTQHIVLELSANEDAPECAGIRYYLPTLQEMAVPSVMIENITFISPDTNYALVYRF